MLSIIIVSQISAFHTLFYINVYFVPTNCVVNQYFTPKPDRRELNSLIIMLTSFELLSSRLPEISTIWHAGLNAQNAYYLVKHNPPIISIESNWRRTQRYQPLTFLIGQIVLISTFIFATSTRSERRLNTENKHSLLQLLWQTNPLFSLWRRLSNKVSQIEQRRGMQL